MHKMTWLALPLSSFGFSALAEAPNVVADTPIAHSLTAQIMEGVGEPSLLLTQGSDPHSFQMRPSQMRDVAGADLIIWTGEGLTPWLERALNATEAAVLELDEAPGLTLRSYGEDEGHHDEHDDEHHDDHDGHAHDDHDGHEDEHHDDHDAHDEHDDHGDHDGHDEPGHDDHHHDHSGIDPHFWLDAGNAEPVLTAIAAQLSALDPENAATYQANAAKWIEESHTLDAELTETLSHAHDVELIFFHDAYGYLAAAYDLTIQGSIREGDAAPTGAGQMAELRDHIHDHVCAFPESNHPEASIATLAEGTDLRVGEALDPAGTNHTPGMSLYGETLRAIATAISACAHDEG